MRGNAVLADHAPQILDVDVQHLGGHRRREDLRQVVSGLAIHRDIHVGEATCAADAYCYNAP